MVDPKDDPTSIGNILLSMGVVTREQLIAIREEQAMEEDRRMGMMLVRKGWCTEEQLDVALAAQKTMRTKGKVGQALALADIAIAQKRSPAAAQRRERIIVKAAQAVEVCALRAKNGRA